MSTYTGHDYDGPFPFPKKKEDTVTDHNEPQRFEVQIEGEYGVVDGSIHLLVDGVEVVMWDSAEWVEDPSVVYVIANAIEKGHAGTLLSLTDLGVDE